MFILLKKMSGEYPLNRVVGIFDSVADAAEYMSEHSGWGDVKSEDFFSDDHAQTWIWDRSPKNDEGLEVQLLVIDTENLKHYVDFRKVKRVVE